MARGQPADVALAYLRKALTLAPEKYLHQIEELDAMEAGGIFEHAQDVLAWMEKYGFVPASTWDRRLWLGRPAVA